MSEPSCDDPVEVAVEEYVARCLDLLRERCPAAGDTDLELGFACWLEDPALAGGVLRLTPDIWEPYRVCAVRELAQLPAEGLPEYQRLVEAMEADPVIGERLGPDTVGGARLGGGALQAETVASELVLDVIKRSEGFHPAPDVVADTIARWLAHLRRKLESVIVLAPAARTSANVRDRPSSWVSAVCEPASTGSTVSATTSVPPSCARRTSSWSAPDFPIPGSPTTTNEPDAAAASSTSGTSRSMLTLPERTSMRTDSSNWRTVLFVSCRSSVMSGRTDGGACSPTPWATSAV
jgi:hypothetical protein